MHDETHTTGGTMRDDESELILDSLITREMRNAADLEAIAGAYDKHVFQARRKARGSDWLTEKYTLQVHDDMFGEIWHWAGKFRQVNLNPGFAWTVIPEQIRLLRDDFLYWDMPDSTRQILEIAARLQNRLTRIHSFKNGKWPPCPADDGYFYLFASISVASLAPGASNPAGQRRSCEIY